MTRFIGIRHRRKRTREGEARPTTVTIRSGGGVVTYDLEDEDSEKDFLLGIFPVAWRKVEPDEEFCFYDEQDPERCPEGWRVRHCKRRKPKADEDLSAVHPSHIVGEDDAMTGKVLKRIVTQVPSAMEGVRAGDRIGMVLGGSGDNFASALSRRGEEVGAEVYRIPPSDLANLRWSDKDDDHLILAGLVETHLPAFQLLRRRDRDSIRVKAVLRLLRDAMKARIACEQQILSSLIGRTFLTEEGRFPEGMIKARYDAEKANDRIYQSLLAEEQRRRNELKRAVQAHPMWESLFASIEGVGERLAAGLIGPIGDIRRFWENSVRMEECYRKAQDAERLGCFALDLRQVASLITDGITVCDKLVLVRQWQLTQGKVPEAEHLQRAIYWHRERGRLLSKGISRLRAYCGVHVINPGPDGAEVPKNRQFPRAARAAWRTGIQKRGRRCTCWATSSTAGRTPAGAACCCRTSFGFASGTPRW